jgi:hypothetical protein
MKIMVIPDTQVKPGVPLDHLEWCGKYIVEKKPDVVVMLGDFADMESLSSYDIGKKSFEGRRYKNDIDVAYDAMGLLTDPLDTYNYKAKKNHEKQYNPRLVLTLGNHEDRIDRAINNDPKLDGLISVKDLQYEGWGWEVHPFMEPVVIGGIAFCHYFPSGQLGRPITSARMLLTKMHMSCVAGHQQGRDIAYGKRADGTSMIGLIAGSFYQHNEAYLNPQTNNHWRGIYVLHNVQDGACDEMAVSLEYLRRKYGNIQ